MEYGDLKIIAAIDWVEFEVSLVNASNHQTLSRALRSFQVAEKVWVEPVEPTSKNKTSRKFRFRLHDPKSCADSQIILTKLGSRFEFSDEPEITAVEVAVDFFSPSHDAERLVEATISLYTYHANLVSENRRASGREATTGQAKGILVRKDLLNAVHSELSLNIGNVSDAVHQRIYLKKKNKQLHLPIAEHRARVEVTLQHENLPFTTIEQWSKFQFSSLANYFKWRKDSVLTPLQQCLRSVQANVGTVEIAQFERLARRTTLSSTVADGRLNDRVYDALRSLTTKQRKPVKLQKNRVKAHVPLLLSA
ncbi:MAG: hypothetical protein Q7V20_14165 [Aquabacterium sp.]|uniref:hypothetical protein n=1 Tax=Aquabacterium sp. TaxID=1872578 RepID=UPI002721169C|nr:hypothetical protein [Aquabacterium sp.]MDO9004589.1 hypothetical protein [Aquabacterium sp.]